MVALHTTAMQLSPEQMSAMALPSPAQVLLRARTELDRMRVGIAERTRGVLVYPDGKAPCLGGVNADDIGAGKTNELDPNHCLISGGPWIRPILQRDVSCENAGEDIVWGSLIEKSQELLRALAASPPLHAATWETKFDYFSVVMELCDVVMQGMNVAPGAITSWLTWGVSRYVRSRDAAGAVFNRQIPANDSPVGKYLSVDLMDQLTMTRVDPAQWGARKFWLRGAYSALGEFNSSPQQSGFNWDTPLVFAPPKIMPTFFASGGMGWAPWITANSRHAKIVQGEIAPWAPGFFGVNCGQSYDISHVAHSKMNWGQQWVSDSCTGAACGMFRYTLPVQVLERITAGATRDGGKAEQALRRAMAMAPSDLVKLIFQTTAGFNPTTLFQGWSFDRKYLLTWYAMPNPARSLDGVRSVLTLGAEFYLLRARDWAKYLGNLDVPQAMSHAIVEYLLRVQKVVEQLQAKGLPVDIKPTDIQNMIKAAQEAASVERMAIIGGLASVFQIMGGIAGAIMQLVATAVLGGFLELLNSATPPQGRDGFSLLVQPFAMRSPPRDTRCSYDPESAGGLERLRSSFTPTGVGGAGELWDIAHGRNPPPAPDGLRRATADEINALLSVLEAERVGVSPFAIGAGVALAAVGGVLLWKYFK